MLARWMSRWWGRAPSNALAARLSALPCASPPDDQRLADVRWVVVDVETTGLNLLRDQVIAIGGVAVTGCTLPLGDQFEAVLRRPELDTQATVLLHGLGAQALAEGEVPELALGDFFAWAGAAVMCAFHAPFDQRMLERALRNLGARLPRYRWMDMADVLPALFPDAVVGDGRLDDWAAHFGLGASARHHAAADAQLTAELLLIALREAHRQAIETTAQLAEKVQICRRLRRQRQV
ncbi:MAG: 3'-5' exonuclease [Gammaproteobacteria bacterium]|nr:3'-5' exonuclease [Gammaproteobacteria bacterium]